MSLWALVLTVLSLLMGPSVPVEGGDVWQRAQVQAVLESQPGLLGFVQDVYPDFHVRVNYGAKAHQGYISVRYDRRGIRFTELVAHEFAHEIQLAAAEPGGPEPIGDKWLDLLSDHGVSYEWDNPLEDNRNPWEMFAVNVELAYFAQWVGELPEGRPVGFVMEAQEFKAWLRNAGVL